MFTEKMLAPCAFVQPTGSEHLSQNRKPTCFLFSRRIIVRRAEQNSGLFISESRHPWQGHSGFCAWLQKRLFRGGKTVIGRSTL